VDVPIYKLDKSFGEGTTYTKPAGAKKKSTRLLYFNVFLHKASNARQDAI
jgi:hypothetical protein